MKLESSQRTQQEKKTYVRQEKCKRTCEVHLPKGDLEESIYQFRISVRKALRVQINFKIYDMKGVAINDNDLTFL